MADLADKTKDDYTILRGHFAGTERRVFDSYKKRLAAQKLVWNGFEHDKSELLNIVDDAFLKLLIEITKDVIISDFKSSYNPEKRKTSINILQVIYKGTHYPKDGNKWDGYCPHGLLSPIIFGADERVRKFKEDFCIGAINEPDNECQHL